MAALFVDENELEKFRQSVLADASRTHYGILIGYALQSKSEVKTTLVAFTPTPCEEGCSLKSFRDFNMERLAAHAREASRYLVGGISVVGFYTASPAADVDSGAVQTAFKSLSSPAALPFQSSADGVERARDTFHVHIDTVKKTAPPKVQSFSVYKDGAIKIQPIMLKAQDAHKDRELIVLHSRFAFSCTISSLRPAGLISIRNCLERCYPSVSNAPKAAQAKDLLGKEIHFFSSSNASETGAGSFLVRGTVTATACVCASAPCKDVFNSLKQDAFSSLRYRLERLHVETNNSKDLDASKQQSLGRRFIVPAFAGGCCISDCVAMHETLDSSLGSLSDVFPSSIATDATVTFVEDEEVQMSVGKQPSASAVATAARSNAVNRAEDKKTKSGMNLIVIIVVALAIIFKFML
jgi:hypothetical protein